MASSRLASSRRSVLRLEILATKGLKSRNNRRIDNSVYANACQRVRDTPPLAFEPRARGRGDPFMSSVKDVTRALPEDRLRKIFSAVGRIVSFVSRLRMGQVLKR